MPGDRMLCRSLCCIVGLTLELAAGAARGQIISELRWSGPEDALDEYVEVYNASDQPLVVTDSSTSPTGTPGWALVGADSPTTPRFVIPAGTVIPPRGHYLIAGDDYSYDDYAAADGTYPTSLTTNRGIALFRTSNAVNPGFVLSQRLDAVGATNEANALFREGAGLPTLVSVAGVEYAWVRRLPGGCTGSEAGAINHNCTTAAATLGTGPPLRVAPQDSNDNAADFLFVETQGVEQNGNNERMGAPGPENLASPTHGGRIIVRALDRCKANGAAPNLFRDMTPGGDNASLGTIFLRLRVINLNSQNLTALRFRIIDLSTEPAGAAANGIADLRALSSLAVLVAGVDDIAPCGAGSQVTVQGTFLEVDDSAPSLGQPLGGGFNATLVAGTVTPGTPMAPGSAGLWQLMFGVEREGAFRLAVVAEAFPKGGSELFLLRGCTDGSCPIVDLFRDGFELGSTAAWGAFIK